MILCFPVSGVDLHLAKPLAKWMRELGPYPRHDALIVWSPEVSASDREEIAVEFRNMGWRTPAKAFQAQIAPHEQNWPLGPNAMFRQTAQMVDRDPSLNRPWYFFEADNTPMMKGWMDALADEYNKDLSKPFLGSLAKTYEIINSTGELNQIGNHMVGTAIYPPLLNRFTRAHLDCRNAFDLAISRDIFKYCRNTEFIQDNWSTANYQWKRQHGRWVIDCGKTELRVKLIGQSLAKPVAPYAQVVHGCKDGSLLQAIRAGHSSLEVRKKPKRRKKSPIPVENSQNIP